MLYKCLSNTRNLHLDNGKAYDASGVFFDQAVKVEVEGTGGDHLAIEIPVSVVGHRFHECMIGAAECEHDGEETGRDGHPSVVQSPSKSRICGPSYASGRKEDIHACEGRQQC